MKVFQLVVVKLLILGVSALASFILTLRVVLVAKLVISGILSSIFFILALYSVFLTKSFFTKLLTLRKWIGVVSNFVIPNLSTLRFKLLKSVDTLFNLSTSAFKLIKSDFAANLDVSIPVAFFKWNFVA